MALAVFSLALGVSGTQAGAFTQYNGPAKFTVTALDPDGNLIIGPGAPAFTIALSAGSGFTIANPTAAAPNTFTLSPTGHTAKAATFTATAAYSDATCATSGAVCSTSFAVTSAFQRQAFRRQRFQRGRVRQALYCRAGRHYDGISGAVAVLTDTGGNLFVANDGNNTVKEYAPPFSGTSVPIATISTGVNGPQQFSLAYYPR